MKGKLLVIFLLDVFLSMEWITGCLWLFPLILTFSRREKGRFDEIELQSIALFTGNFVRFHLNSGFFGGFFIDGINSRVIYGPGWGKGG